ncbi:DNA circularization N-terminal domain-containing protein, partial [Acinetobacter baumannii]
MTWRDQLRPASFRGVPFHVTQATGTFGRRSVTHEYPFRDLPYVEDLGRRARTLRIEALLLGEDYMA